MLKKVTALLMTMKPYRHLVSIWPLLLAIAISYNTHNSIVITSLLILSFILFYSGIYQINEIVDLQRDKLDPIRAKRPLASGVVTTKEVLMCAVLLIFVGTAIVSLLRPLILLCYTALFIINMLYVFVLKKYPYIDLLILAITPTIKFIIGIITTTSAFSFPMYFGILIMIYLVILAFQIQKQVIRFQSGRTSTIKGKFVIDVKVLTYIRNISLVFAFVMLFQISSPGLWFFLIYTIGLALFIVFTSLKWAPIIGLLREYDRQ